MAVKPVRNLQHLFIAMLLLACCLSEQSAVLAATVYQVGPGRSIPVIDQVPWEQLQPGDRVEIDWRPKPYRGKWVLCRRGTAQNPIVVRGISGPQGERPVIDGSNAITRPALNFWGEQRGVLKIGGANRPEDTMPAHLVIENLEFRGARQGNSFFGRNGITGYVQNAAGLFLEKGEDIVLRKCTFQGNGNGLFIAAASRRILVEGCRIENNGHPGSWYEHNAYTEAAGITYQYNRFGPLMPGAGGNNLKDRSAGLVVRYNWIEGGNRQLDLVDAEGSDELIANPAYHETFVYGNILVEQDDDGNSQIVHYGGDSGNEASYRHGVLYFYHNTVLSRRSGPTTLFRLSSAGESVDCRNNILFTTAGGNHLAILDEFGRVELRNNMMRKGWKVSHSQQRGAVLETGAAITADLPGFVNLAANDFRLTADSPCIDQGANLAPAALPQFSASRQWDEQNLLGTGRPVQGPADLGAFEYSPASPPR